MIFRITTEVKEGLIWGEDLTDIHLWAKEICKNNWGKNNHTPWVCGGSYIITSTIGQHKYHVRYRKNDNSVYAYLERIYNEYAD